MVGTRSTLPLLSRPWQAFFYFFWEGEGKGKGSLEKTPWPPFLSQFSSHEVETFNLPNAGGAKPYGSQSNAKFSTK